MRGSLYLSFNQNISEDIFQRTNNAKAARIKVNGLLVLNNLDSTSSEYIFQRTNNAKATRTK